MCLMAILSIFWVDSLKIKRSIYLILFYDIAEADDLSHARTLVEILIDQENPELKDMKLSVAIYLKNVYRIISAIGHN